MAGIPSSLLVSREDLAGVCLLGSSGALYCLNKLAHGDLENDSAGGVLCEGQLLAFKDLGLVNLEVRKLTPSQTPCGPRQCCSPPRDAFRGSHRHTPLSLRLFVQHPCTSGKACSPKHVDMARLAHIVNVSANKVQWG